ncbi:MAG: cupin domain-containing protein [bacterium]|nr:cupin domain-containing protein [bacterium]
MYYDSDEYRCPYCGKLFRNDFYAMNSNETYVDYGPRPFIFDIEEEVENNRFFRASLWSGQHLQLTVMNVKVGDEIGAEVHDDLDQFLKIEEGNGMLYVGSSKDNWDYNTPVDSDNAIIIPAGTWHNLVNAGRSPLKLFSIYAPPAHPANTIHQTKAEADAAEENH